MDALARYGALAPAGSTAGGSWFRLGDRDLATHLYRTRRLDEGASLSLVTAEIVKAWGLGLRVLPMTDDRVETRVTVAEGEIGFQEYFVGRQHAVPVRSVRLAGIESARPAPGVIAAVTEADTLVVCPSNPIVSIGPIRAVPGIEEALVARRRGGGATVAVSPIIAGAAVKGPADRLLSELGHESSVVGVARLYAPIISALVIDEADAERAAEVESEGMACIVAPTLMSGAAEAAALAGTVLGTVAR
jgi:LPPG:FO 2-phospho-L-lactate transferase